MLIRSPGRVNLIGEHTDYNDGFVFPLAIERATWLALRPRDDGQVILHSLAFGDTARFPVVAPAVATPEWARYAAGTAALLRRAGHPLHGFEAVVSTDVPVGAGLSSSASFTLGVARAFQAIGGFPWDPSAMARLGQQVEHEHLGVNCGIMDQLAISAARAGHALLLDCRSLAMSHVPLPAGCSIIILDTRRSRTLAGSAYNERRAQCEAAARFLGVASLRDATRAQLDAAAGRLDPLVWRRARHVITENTRVQEAAAALAAHDAGRLGRLMNDSHSSLRDDYEVSCQELDVITELARTQPGCLGARMTGAGFGGCAVALVRSESAATLAAAVGPAYRARCGLDAAIYITTATDGAAPVPLS
ncbi:MAG: galactokinase [Opitutales bacterium]